MNRTEEIERRRERLAVLARADAQEIDRLWSGLGINIGFHRLKGPVSGLIALHGRIGGGGDPFQFGEATLARAVIELNSGQIGYGQTLGRDLEKAERCAVIDALARHPEHADRIETEIIAVLRDQLEQADRSEREKVAATKVDFFTLVRGED